MDIYTTTRTSHECPCGGRVCSIPDIVRRHNETKKHTQWLWETRCEKLAVATTRAERIRLAVTLRDLVSNPSLLRHS